jgi:orotate phosphoribosyltransferase
MQGLIKSGHFELTSGLHADSYVQVAELLKDPWELIKACEQLSVNARLVHEGAIDYIISPAVGAIPVGYEVARQMGLPFVFAERVDGKMTLRRDFAIMPDKNYMIVEDVITSGSSVAEVDYLVHDAGGHVLRTACVVLRGEKKYEFMDIPLDFYGHIDLETWQPDECPLCAENVPLYRPGSRNLTGF